MELYHATSKRNLASIFANGLQACSYWATDENLADYYLDTIADEGESPILLRVKLKDLAENKLSPDYPGIVEPISGVIGKNEETVLSAWEQSARTWQDSLAIISSVRYEAVIPPDKLSIEFGDWVTLAEYMVMLKRS